MLVITHGVSDRTVCAVRRGAGGHQPLLPGQGAARASASGGTGDLVLGPAPGAAAPHPGPPAAGVHAGRDPPLPGGGAGALGRGTGGGGHGATRPPDAQPGGAGRAQRGRGAAAARPRAGRPAGAGHRRCRAALPGRGPGGPGGGADADRGRGSPGRVDGAGRPSRGRGGGHGQAGRGPLRPPRPGAHPGRRDAGGGGGATAARHLPPAPGGERHAGPTPLPAGRAPGRPRAHRARIVSASTRTGMAGSPLELEHPPDLVLLAGAARDAGQEVMLFERSAPESVSVLGIGRRYELVSVPGGVALEYAECLLLDQEPGPRLEAAARLWRRLTARVVDLPGLPEAGPVALGGFAFDLDREPGGPWLGFPALLLRVPALTLALVGGRAFAAGDLALLPQPSSPPGAGTARIDVEPRPAEAEWARLVGRARDRLRRGAARKVVLAREVVARGDRPITAGAVARRLVGASPELLVRRSGAVAICQPMAGSIGRGGDGRADATLAERLRTSRKDVAEHRLTVAHVTAALRRLGAQVSVGSPEVLRLPNIQHLATRVEARLGLPPHDLLEVADR